MREITLEDRDIKNLIVYDTSGSYSDQNYNHSYEKALNQLDPSGSEIEKGTKRNTQNQAQIS